MNKTVIKSMIKDFIIMLIIGFLIGSTLYWLSHKISVFLDIELGPYRQSIEKWY